MVVNSPSHDKLVSEIKALIESAIAQDSAPEDTAILSSVGDAWVKGELHGKALLARRILGLLTMHEEPADAQF